MGINITSTEKKLLEKILQENVITKSELNYFLKQSISTENSDAILNSTTKKLMQKGFISLINPVGSICYVITQKGTRFLRN